MSSSSSNGSSSKTRDLSEPDFSNMAKKSVQGATLSFRKISDTTATMPSGSAKQELPATVISRAVDHMINHVITSTIPTMVANPVTLEPTVFFPNPQSPIDHLSLLRNPTRAYERPTPGFSSGLSNGSEAYIRFLQRQYFQDRVIIQNKDHIEGIKNRVHRMAQLERYQKAKKSSSNLTSLHHGWVLSREPTKRYLDKMQEDADFWRSFSEDKEKTPNSDGGEDDYWEPNGEPILMGDAIESKMQLEGRSLKEWGELKKAVHVAEQEERHQAMVKHREQWRQSKYVPAGYNSDSDSDEDDDDEDYHLYDFADPPPVRVLGGVEEQEDDEDSDDDYHLCDFADPPPAKLSEEKTNEDVANSPASPSRRAQLSFAHINQLDTILEEDENVETSTYSSEEELVNMASTTKGTQEVITATDAIISFAKFLLANLEERREFYCDMSNLHMNHALEALQPSRLTHNTNNCQWTVRPLAMTKKNLTPPPADQIPSIRLINPSGVTCELIQGFADVSKPRSDEYEDYVENKVHWMTKNLDEWQATVETDEEYQRRHACEVFWDQCSAKDTKRRMEQERAAREDPYEDDSDDDVDRSHNSRSSRSTSFSTSVSDNKDEDGIFGKNNTTKQDRTSSSEEEKTEPSESVKLARANLASYRALLAAAVASTKSERLAAAKANLASSLQAAEKASKKSRALYAQGNLCLSILRLRLRMDLDGLACNDTTGLNYTSTTALNRGAGAITFTGPITTFLATRKDILDCAFEKLRNDERVLGIHRMDFWMEVKMLMGQMNLKAMNPVLWRKDSQQALVKKSEEEKRVGDLVVKRLQQADMWVRELEKVVRLMGKLSLGE